MSNHNNQGSGSRLGGNGGGSKFSGSKFGGNSKKPFSTGGRFGNRGGDRQTAMHKAICTECGNSCEVPFRPSGEKPVYCKNCFGSMSGGNMGGDRFPRKNDAPQTRVWPPAEKNKVNDAVVKQLEEVNGKLERLIQAVSALVASTPVVENIKPKKKLNNKSEKK